MQERATEQDNREKQKAKRIQNKREPRSEMHVIFSRCQYEGWSLHILACKESLNIYASVLQAVIDLYTNFFGTSQQPKRRWQSTDIFDLTTLKKCTCLPVLYCNTDCQQKAWKLHKQAHNLVMTSKSPWSRVQRDKDLSNATFFKVIFRKTPL